MISRLCLISPLYHKKPVLNLKFSVPKNWICLLTGEILRRVHEPSNPTFSDAVSFSDLLPKKFSIFGIFERKVSIVECCPNRKLANAKALSLLDGRPIGRAACSESYCQTFFGVYFSKKELKN